MNQISLSFPQTISPAVGMHVLARLVNCVLFVDKRTHTHIILVSPTFEVQNYSKYIFHLALDNKTTYPKPLYFNRR